MSSAIDEYEENYSKCVDQLGEALTKLALRAARTHSMKEASSLREEALTIKTWISAAIDYKAMCVMERILRPPEGITWISPDLSDRDQEILRKLFKAMREGEI